MEQNTMILAYRSKPKHRCRQYVFDDKKAAFKFFQKPAYWMENITLIEYSDTTNREISELTYRNNWTKWPVINTGE